MRTNKQKKRSGGVAAGLTAAEIRAEVRRAIRDELGLAPARGRGRRHATLAAGTKLEHRRRGEVLATATVTSDGVRYRGRVYPSVSAAANAAARDLKQKSKTLNGWIFWGLEKRRRPATAVAARQTRAEATSASLH